jgi:hypothetical protein
MNVEMQRPQGLNLSHMRAAAGDDDVDLFGDNNPFKPDCQYAVQITEQSVSIAQKGLALLKLTIVQVLASGRPGMKAKLSITLPVFSPKAKDNYGQDKLDMMRDMNAKLLNQIIRATYPEDFTGDIKDAGKIVMGAAKMLLKSELPLKGKRCYYMRNPGKKDRMFDNFSAAQFEELPLAQ